MSKRIFVNFQNTQYRDVIKISRGLQFGLGVPIELSPAQKESIGQRPNEIFFTEDELREKKRKLQIVLDSFIDPKFFADGSVKIDKVKQYVDLELEAARTRAGVFGNVSNATENLINLASAAQFGSAVAGAVGLGVGGIVWAAASVLPLTAIAGLVSTTFNSIKRETQAGREDRAAPWKMKREDFPLITGQAIATNANKRSIERLYDDRQFIGGTNLPTKAAIARLVRECLADALFTKKATDAGASTVVPEHPLREDPKALSEPRYFLFREVTQGIDQTEQTYVKAILYLYSYIALVDNIINLQDESLSRTPDTEEAIVRLELTINLSTAVVPLYEAMAITAQQTIREKVLTFFDKNREYKTLLNFGNDRQYIAEAWRLSRTTGSVQLKLLKPLDNEVDVNTFAFISRELAQSVIDIVNFDLSPIQDTTPYLRPFNMDTQRYTNSRMSVNNVTLSSLQLATGSAGINSGTEVTYKDSVFRRWFTGDFNASELNVDFTNYKNFIHFGLASARLNAFKEKLIRIEKLTSESMQIGMSSSIAQAALRAREKEYIIRTFDPYEQFLYFATGSIPYSASAYYAVNEIEFAPIAYWPKQAQEVPYSPYSTIAADWFTTQSAIAHRYDEVNVNNLVQNLPTHIREDIESTDFLTFVGMIGHLLDNIKLYIDQFPNIYATSINPLEDLSMDQVYEVAQSFGLQLPNVYALENLQTFNAQFVGESGSRVYVTETWKRFLHSMIYLAKTKGSRTSFNALMNVYGINSPILQLKETSYPVAGNYVQSEELTYGLYYTGSTNSFITIPLVSSSLVGKTVQVSFRPTTNVSSSLITAAEWAINLIPHPSESKQTYGQIHVLSGSSQTLIASSSYFPLFSEDFTHLMLRSGSADISIIQTDGDQILFRESASVNWSLLWNTTQVFYLGGSGSNKLPNNFAGVIDEVRVWGENISDEDFLSHAYDPGSFYADTYTSAYTALYVHIPFSQRLMSVTQSILNESPYQNVSIVQSLPAIGFTTESYTRILRSIKQFSPLVGSTVYTNKKVTVAPPPVFNRQFLDADGTYRLSRRESIKLLEDKKYSSGQNIVSFAISPTDFINQNIVRSMGVISVNDIIGSPRYIKGTDYTSLQNIEKDYLKYFNKTVNPNEYIRFFKDLIEGPGEAAHQMVPARAKLLDGIVIESPVISRNKDTTIRSIKVDGSSTKRLDRYITAPASGASDIGAYDFSTDVKELNLHSPPVGDILPLDGKLEMTDLVVIQSSTPVNKIPPSRQSVQKLGNSFVTSSVQDAYSSYPSLEANSIDITSTLSTVSDGYPRTPYRSLTTKVSDETDTTFPFYDIKPRSNLFDIGTVTYFHKQNGIYSYDIYTLYKQPYLVLFDSVPTSPVDILTSPLTLLNPDAAAGNIGRESAQLPAEIYGNLTNNFGTLRIARLFSLYALNGLAGRRLRLYASSAAQSADVSRPFDILPTQDAVVLFDAILDEGTEVFPYVIINCPEQVLYYTITGAVNEMTPSGITLYYFVYEPDIRTPSGYLPRHYKFSRDNSTALKRRNYLGCKETEASSEGRPPFTVTIAGKNTAIVNSDAVTGVEGLDPILLPESNVIKFGGRGRLTIE
jgi:hypothetical protein